eukprot:TRINITY_DN2296_c0_g1_i1.p1 TRINITY_DN2296_c0_g1~~TRINITY_DN2296_c0_g1_i1.p1  ORF type:complete len:446 (-),score=135.90 TRINITY_DN2296_c0_g1_i1:159-1496(-)
MAPKRPAPDPAPPPEKKIKKEKDKEKKKEKKATKEEGQAAAVPANKDAKEKKDKKDKKEKKQKKEKDQEAPAQPVAEAPAPILATAEEELTMPFSPDQDDGAPQGVPAETVPAVAPAVPTEAAEPAVPESSVQAEPAQPADPQVESAQAAWPGWGESSDANATNRQPQDDAWAAFSEGAQYTGVVRTIKQDRSFGFITCADASSEFGGDPQILSADLHNLNEGDEVSFTVEVRNDVPIAKNITVTSTRTLSTWEQEPQQAQESSPSKPARADEWCTGKVKTVKKDFGFIACSDGRDIFFSLKGFWNAAQGQEVDFKVVYNQQGKPQARSVKVKRDETQEGDGGGSNWNSGGWSSSRGGNSYDRQNWSSSKWEGSAGAWSSTQDAAPASAPAPAPAPAAPAAAEPPVAEEAPAEDEEDEAVAEAEEAADEAVAGNGGDSSPAYDVD